MAKLNKLSIDSKFFCIFWNHWRYQWPIPLHA